MSGRSIARRVDEIGPFEVMEVLSRAQALDAAGSPVVHMEIGEPDFTAPPPVVEAALRALRDGRTAYTPALGIAPLREALSDHYARRLQAIVPASRIAVTAGASGALLLAIALYVERDDEILVPDPGYPGYRHMIRAMEGAPRAMPVRAADQFQPTARAVREAWGPRTTGLILGTPANPSGTRIARAELLRIAEFVAERAGVLIVDEIYQGLVYDSEPWTAAGFPGDVVLVNSFSKYFSMTGWRLGWAVLPERHLRGLEKLAQHLYICPSAIAQHAACAAFGAEATTAFEERRRAFAARRDLLTPALKQAGLEIPAQPTGAFYVYADCSAFSRDSKQFALELLEQGGVAATPGADFGSHDSHRMLRFAYTRSIDDIAEGARRIAQFCAGLSAGERLRRA